MKNSADLEGCYPPRPSVSVDNALLDLRNSSYPTQPHSTIAKYRAWPELVPRIALLRLPCLINHKESNPERAWERGLQTKQRQSQTCLTRQKEKRFMKIEVGTHCKLTGTNDTVECVSLQETFELHVKP